jgi:hypothetical protein
MRPPVRRLRPTGNEDRVNVLYWFSKGKWSQVGDFGGVILPLDEAFAYVAKNGIFLELGLKNHPPINLGGCANLGKVELRTRAKINAPVCRRDSLGMSWIPYWNQAHLFWHFS